MRGVLALRATGRERENQDAEYLHLRPSYGQGAWSGPVWVDLCSRPWPIRHTRATGFVLRGRRRECAAIDRVLDGVRAGRSGVLVLRGEPGVGKSALLELRRRLRRMPRRPGGRGRLRDGARVRRPAPAVRADARSARAAAGPAARRARHGVRADARAAARSLPRRAGRPDPALRGRRRSGRWCASSTTPSGSTARRCETLAFVARRLFAESVALIVATREPHDELAGLPELVVDGLGDGATRAPCWTPSSRDRSTSACATASSPSRAATRSRCSSSHAA